MSENALVAALEEAYQHIRSQSDLPLGHKLSFIADQVRTLSSTFAEAVDRLVERLEGNGAGLSAPDLGEPMPPFLLPSEKGELIGLTDLLEEGPVAIAFHRGHWCPYCRLNADALSAAEESVKAAGAQLVAIMPDRNLYTNALRREVGGTFPLLTDMDNGYALSLNLAIWVGGEMQELIAAAGWDLSHYQGNDSWLLPIPAVFVVGRDGLIKARHIDPDYRRRMDIDKLIAAVRAAS